MTLLTTVSSGDFGLDVLLGGGLTFVERVAGKRSATVLVRGGAGVGKSIWSLQLATVLANELDGDVLVACVEILPREVLAQSSSTRPDLTRIAALPERPPDGFVPAIVVGLLPDMDPQAVDLVAGIEHLREQAIAAGTRPVAVVVDSLIQDYLGAPTRLQADALMKYAGSEGIGLVLCEEQLVEIASPWVFAADTVIELATGLDTARTGRARTLQVQKHRFGGSVSGRHAFRFTTGCPEVAPHPASWPIEARPAEAPELAQLSWVTELGARPADVSIAASLVCVAAEDGRTAAVIAAGLVPENLNGSDVVFRVDAIGGGGHAHEAAIAGVIVHVISPTIGPGFELRRMLELLDRMAEAREPVSRFVIGDVRALISSPESKAWVQAIQTFASRVVSAGLAAPVVCYGSGKAMLSSDLLDVAEATVTAAGDGLPHLMTVRRRGYTSLSVGFPDKLRLPERLLAVAD